MKMTLWWQSRQKQHKTVSTKDQQANMKQSNTVKTMVWFFFSQSKTKLKQFVSQQLTDYTSLMAQGREDWPMQVANTKLIQYGLLKKIIKHRWHLWIKSSVQCRPQYGVQWVHWPMTESGFRQFLRGQRDLTNLLKSPITPLFFLKTSLRQNMNEVKAKTCYSW